MAAHDARSAGFLDLEAAHAALRQVTGGLLRPGGLDLTRRALALLGLAPGAKVLDAGCGFGASVEFLAREAGLHALGLDFSWAKLVEARMSLPRAPLLLADAQRLPLAVGCLDAVFCECVLSLTPDPAAVLTEFHRVLKPGRGLALSDVYARQGRAPAAGEARCCLDRAMDRASLETLLGQSGFTVLVFEDHTPLLTRLAAEMIFAGHSRDALRVLSGSASCNAGADASRTMQPGYCLIAARKQG